jgi:hypothetical protein
LRSAGAEGFVVIAMIPVVDAARRWLLPALLAVIPKVRTSPRVMLPLLSTSAYPVITLVMVSCGRSGASGTRLEVDVMFAPDWAPVPLTEASLT